jgi:hypothetical protein
MSASDHLSDVQFMDIRQVGKLPAGDYPGFTMSQYHRAPHKVNAASGTVERYSHQDLRDLTESMRTHGWRPEDAMHLGAGEHRYRAARLAGIKRVPVVHDGGALDAAVTAGGW